MPLLNLATMRILTFVFVLSSLNAFAQNDTIFKYFDKSWEPVAPEQAYFTGT